MVIVDNGCARVRADSGVDFEALTKTKGLLELYHIPADADSKTEYTSGNDYPGPGVGFGHIGFTVPDVSAAIQRAKEFGYEVIKPLDQAGEDQMAMPPAVVEGKYGPVSNGYKHVYKQLAFVRDPDVSCCAYRDGDCVNCFD